MPALRIAHSCGGRRRQSFAWLPETTLPAAAMIAMAGVARVIAGVAVGIIELQVHALPVAQAEPGVTEALTADAGLLGGAHDAAGSAVVAVGVLVGALPLADALVPPRRAAALAALTDASGKTRLTARATVLRVAALVDALSVAHLVPGGAGAIACHARRASRADGAALPTVLWVALQVD